MAIWQFDCMVIPKRNEGLPTDSDEILSWGKEEKQGILDKEIARVLEAVRVERIDNLWKRNCAKRK